MKKAFLKFSDERNKKYSIKTEINFSSENKSVIKSSVFEEGREHLNHIVEASDKLKKYFSNVEICPVKKIENGISFDFIEGKLMLNNYMQLMKENNITEYEKLLKYHKDIICGDENNRCVFKNSKEFEHWFGDGSGYEGSEGLVYSNFDAIAGNIVMNDNVPVFIDYEWTLDFTMPKDLVVYHCVYDAYIHNPSLEEFYPMDKVLVLLGIAAPKELLDVSYKKFFDYVVCDETGASYAKDKFKCLKLVHDVSYIAEQWQLCAQEWQKASDNNQKMQDDLDYARAE